LVHRATSGDRQAFAQLALASQDRIYNALRKMTGNEQDAADLTQETFLKALQNVASFRGESSAYTWLFRIALNLATSRLRQIRARRTVAVTQLTPRKIDGEALPPRGILDDRPNASPRPEEVAQNHERDRQVSDALGRLPEEQRNLLVLRDVEGMEYQQIAELLSVPLGTLKSRLFRARLALRDELKGYFEVSEATAS
jgi:RNA polymerase sigma-70 factor (ECF subfamily)